MAEESLWFEVLRYRPDTDSEPVFQSYTVPCKDEWSIIDALNHIKDNLDGTLSYRWSCRMAVCGSCGMMVNGEPKLACKTFIRDLPKDKITLEPLEHFPIERDLIIDIDSFLEKLESLTPFVVPAEERAISEGEYIQTPDQLMDFKQYSMCINCLLCYSACPEFGLDTDFLGPAALSLALRYNKDSRDGAAAQRIRVANTDKGVWPCMFVGSCSEVCPKHVNPASAVQQIKIASLADFYTNLLTPRGNQDGGAQQ